MSRPADLTPEEGASARARVDQSNALIILQTVENRHFSSLASASAYLKSLSPEERFEIVNEQASKLVAVQESLSKCFERWGENNVKYHFAHLLEGLRGQRFVDSP